MTEVNEPRRRFLIGATSFVAGAGVVGVATPFVQSLESQCQGQICRSSGTGGYQQN